MPMRVPLLILLIFLPFLGFAQSGNYFLSHFSPDEERFNITCFDIEQDDRGVFYFATQAGVLQFDGRNWDIIQTTGTLYAIARSADGQLFVGGSSGFGKIVNNEKGIEVYESLYTAQSNESVFQIVTIQDQIYFMSERTVFVYDLSSGKITKQEATAVSGSFISLLELFNKPIVSAEKGFLEIESKRFGVSVPDSAAIIFSLPYKDQYLVGTENNRLFIGRSKESLQEIPLQDEVYARASVLVNATWVNENLIAIGTLRGGVLFIDPNTGETKEIINYNTGLPDNEVFSLVTDKNKNVWVAHSYGFTRIAPFLPFRSFRYYPGLQGNVLCATTYKGSVYAGTSAGLFKLTKEDFYDEIDYYIEVPIGKTITKKSKTANTADNKEPEVLVEEAESKKGLFGFLRRKKKQDQAVENKIPDTGVAKRLEEETIPQGYKREKRTRKILRKSHFVYKPIAGIDSKITQLINWNGRLIAAGIDGVFEIGEKLVRISQEPSRFVFASEHHNRIIVSTYDAKLHQYQFSGGWKEIRLIQEIGEPINYIFEEDSTAIWLCGYDRIFRIDQLTTEPRIQTHTISKHTFDKLLGINLNKEVFIVNTSGFYFYDKEKGVLAQGDTLRKPIAYFADQGNLWFRDNRSWFTAGQSGGNANLQLLNLFSSIRFMSADAETGNLWIVTGNNELLQFNSDTLQKDNVLYPLILKSIESNSVLLPKQSRVKLEQDKSAVKLEVVKPDFIGARFVQYRYQLNGINQQWSAWSTGNNIIDFPYLPTGEYQLVVQSRDIFGRINELPPITISVTPPYWKQTWFYAAEFSVFLFFVIMSFRLSYRFIFISRVLSLLSIIIFIEFIQTIAGSTFSTKNSPVFDFVIQVGVAFVVLPVEGFLRRYFLQAITRRNQAKLQQMMGTDEEELRKPLKEEKITDVQE